MKRNDTDIVTMLRNNPVFKHALEMAKSEEEKKEIEQSAVKYASQIIDVFSLALSNTMNAPTVSPSSDTIIVNERTGHVTDGTRE